MTNKYWYKIETNKSGNETYNYVGTSNETLETLGAKIKAGDFIRLDDLLYMERGAYKEWSEWDKSLQPSASINPSCIITIMQFKGDPRVVPDK